MTREIHAVKKTRAFHNNENENISGQSIGGAALIRGRRLLTFLFQMQRLLSRDIPVSRGSLFDLTGYTLSLSTVFYLRYFNKNSLACFDSTITKTSQIESKSL